MVTYGSACSGIESASVAWEPLGFKPLWFSEVEKFPKAVLNHYWPTVPDMGDMTRLPEYIRLGLLPAPDVFVAGTPCQAFSIAGLRNGLDDGRGQLTLKYVEVLDAIDEQRPGNECIGVWENVPGTLSSKDNAFGCFLAALVGEDDPLVPAGKKWTNAGCVSGPKRSAAWRILDAQYFGVAQRRRRLFVIVSARKGFSPTEVLFESEGVRRDIAPSRETGQGIAGDVKDGVGSSVFENHPNDSRVKPMGEVCSSVVSRWGTGGGNIPLVLRPPVVYGLQGAGKTSQRSRGSGWNKDVSFTLNTIDVHGVATTMRMREGKPGGGKGPLLSEERSLTLASGNDQVLFQPSELRLNGKITMKGVAPTLKAGTKQGDTEAHVVAPTLTASNDPSRSPQSSEVTKQVEAVHKVTSAVRRLTPRECERLQGFPDDYTRILYSTRPKKITESDLIYHGSEAAAMQPDSPRYKAIGNSKAVPVIRWIGKRIQDAIKPRP